MSLDLPRLNSPHWTVKSQGVRQSPRPAGRGSCLAWKNANLKKVQGFCDQCLRMTSRRSGSRTPPTVRSVGFEPPMALDTDHELALLYHLSTADTR